jgi:transposase
LVYNRVANRDDLLILAKLNAPTPIYAANTIATTHGHLLYYTRPYHPTLQSIELIWGLVKN